MVKIMVPKSYEQMDDLGGGFSPLFLVQHPFYPQFVGSFQVNPTQRFHKKGTEEKLEHGDTSGTNRTEYRGPIYRPSHRGGRIEN